MKCALSQDDNLSLRVTNLYQFSTGTLMFPFPRKIRYAQNKFLLIYSEGLLDNVPKVIADADDSGDSEFTKFPKRRKTFAIKQKTHYVCPKKICSVRYLIQGF